MSGPVAVFTDPTPGAKGLLVGVDGPRARPAGVPPIHPDKGRGRARGPAPRREVEGQNSRRGEACLALVGVAFPQIGRPPTGRGMPRPYGRYLLRRITLQGNSSR